MWSRNLFQLKNWEERAKASSVQDPEQEQQRAGDGALALPGFIHWCWGKHRKPFSFPHPQPSPDARPRKIAGFKAGPGLVYSFKLRLTVDFPVGWGAPSHGTREEQPHSQQIPGQNWGEPPRVLPSQLGIRQVKLNPGLNETPQPTDNSTQVSKISNNNK